MSTTWSRRRRTISGAVVALAIFLLVGASSCMGPRQWNCPTSIPGAPGQSAIPVIVVADDGGRRLSDAEVANQSGPEPACEADANRNNIGDEFEVEQAENALNNTGDDG